MSSEKAISFDWDSKKMKAKGEPAADPLIHLEQRKKWLESASGADLPIDALPAGCYRCPMLGESENRSSLTRAALSTRRRATSRFVSVVLAARPCVGCGDRSKPPTKKCLQV
jgi:hypothetical protein